MDADTAVALAARSLAEARSLDPAASTWVSTEYARALGYQVRAQAPLPPLNDTAPPPVPGMLPPYAPTQTTNSPGYTQTTNSPGYRPLDAVPPTMAPPQNQWPPQSPPQSPWPPPAPVQAPPQSPWQPPPPAPGPLGPAAPRARRRAGTARAYGAGQSRRAVAAGAGPQAVFDSSGAVRATARRPPAGRGRGRGGRGLPGHSGHRERVPVLRRETDAHRRRP